MKMGDRIWRFLDSWAGLFVFVCALYACLSLLTAGAPSPTTQTSFKPLGYARPLIVLRGADRFLWNEGYPPTGVGPVHIYGDPADPPLAGIVLSRRTVTLANGATIKASVHCASVRDVYMTGKFRVAGLVNLGVEKASIENVTVDAECGVAGVILSSVDLWGLGVPAGPTLSGGTYINVNSYNWIGGDSSAWLIAGTVTDQTIIDSWTTGKGTARWRLHTLPGYWYELPDGRQGYTDARPNRITIRNAVGEGVFSEQWLETRDVGTAFPANVRFLDGPTWTQVERTQPLPAAPQ